MFFCMNSSLLFILTILPLIYCVDPEVTVKLGTLRGHLRQIHTSFAEEYLGIPYAKPPIGSLRFAKPQELTEKWTTTFIAEKISPACYQTSKIPMSEDCLYLNVWTPNQRTANASLPVMFWIHGGGFASGNGGSTNGAILSVFTQSVVITINYRLNAFGFLFGNTDAVAGNVGLYDQALAMKWVNENIAQFGGNPNLVTIFGVSAGSWSVSLHLMSTLSWPYFKNAIMMSGVEMDYLGVEPKENALKKAKALANVVGCNVENNVPSLPAEVVQCLQNKDANLIVKALSNPNVTQAGQKFPFSYFFTFLPVFGEDFIAMEPRRMWKEQHFKPNSSLLFGTVFNEFVLHHIIQSPHKPSETMKISLSAIIPPQFLRRQQIEQLVKIYFLGLDEVKHRNEALQIATQLFDDITFHCPSQAFAEGFLNVESNSVSQYVFNYKSRRDNPRCDPRYPCHGSDVPFTFGAIASYHDDLIPTMSWMKILGDFARTGNTFWPKHYRTPDKQLVPVFYEFKGNVDISTTQVGFRHFRCQTWKNMVIK